jgi:hypothetical protein
MLGKGELPSSQKNHQQETYFDHFAGIKNRLHRKNRHLFRFSPLRSYIGHNWFNLVAFWFEKSDFGRSPQSSDDVKIQMQSTFASKARESWVESTMRGFEALAGGRRAEAAYRCLAADATLSATRVFDPLSAASRSNAGAAHLLIGQLTEAERCFADAERAWQRVIAGVETIDVPMTGASSSFHFRLAAKIPAVLIDARRERYRRLAEVGRAIMRFNLAFLDAQNAAASHLAERSAVLKATLCEILGARSPEVGLLDAFAGSTATRSIDAIYADKLAVLEECRKTFAAALLEDCAQLKTAVALTALLSPSMFDAVHVGQSTIGNANQHELE